MNRYLRRITSTVLAAVGASGSNRFDIDYIDGFSPPNIVAEPVSYHWETRTGGRIYYPSAYSKKGWSSMCYVSATRGTIRVGKGWVLGETA